MKGRITFGLLCAAVLAFACGPRASTSDSANAVRATRAKTNSQTGPALVSSLAVTVKNGVALSFRVMNTSAKRLEVNFASCKTHEVVVVDSLGREVFRWSKDRMFTQSIQNKVLHASDTLDFDATWKNAPAGKYTAIATLASDNFPMEQRTDFVVH